MSNPFGDQASGLRKLFGGRPLRVISFVAASEGVGKTHVVANLAAAMAERGRKVLVLDENGGQDNVAGLFGGHSGHDLLDAIWGRQAVESVLGQPVPGVWVCPAAKAFRQLGGFGGAEQKFLLETLGGLPTPPDTILIDAAHDHPLGFSPVGLVAQETVVVLSGQTHAITGAYALIKAVASAYGRRNFSALVNKVRTAVEAEQIFLNLSKVAAQRGVAEISFAGVLPQDEAVAHAAWMKKSVLHAFPDALATDGFRRLAAQMEQWDLEADPAGVEQFMKQLLHCSKNIPMPLANARNA